jgi:Tfp pilus assembly protein FimV
MDEYAKLFTVFFVLRARDRAGKETVHLGRHLMEKSRGITMKTRATVLGLVVVIGLSIALPPHLQAFSVGEIAVRSSRGMPFVAEIPLFLEAQERSKGIVVTLGEPGEYRAEGLTRSGVIDTLKAHVTSGARDVISISSSAPVQEAAFDLLLLVHAGHITIVKTYHVVFPLPPSPLTPQVSKAAAAPQPQRERVTASPPSVQPKHASAKPLASAWAQRLPERYGPIEWGATLYSVVEELGVPKDQLWQAIVLVWQANKHEFLSGNLHGLRKGMWLTIPPGFADSLATLGRAEAQRIVAAEWENWQALRQAASGQQDVTQTREEPAILVAKVASASDQTLPPSEQEAPASEQPPTPKEKLVAASEVLSTPSDQVPATGVSMPSLPKEKVTSSAAVVLPAKSPLRAVEVTELRSALQGLEELLTRRLPQAEPGKDMTTFVSVTELQTALQGLEERLMQRVQDSLAQATVWQRRGPFIDQVSLPVEKASVLEAWLSSNTMVYVLAVESALLLLLAIGILWRWYRSRA